MPRTLYDKLWDNHVVADFGDGDALPYIDRQLVQEVSSPQACAARRRPPAVPAGTHLAVADHAVSTRRHAGSAHDPRAAAQFAELAANAAAFDVRYLPLAGARHGIVHVIGPELGMTLPGLTLVCGDSRMRMHGAFGALAFGIGASEYGTVMATQCLQQTRAKTMHVAPTGALAIHFGEGRRTGLSRRGRPARSDRPCRRVRRSSYRRPIDGRADDVVQHDDRGGWPLRSRRPRRHDLRFRPRSADGTDGAEWDAAVASCGR